MRRQAQGFTLIEIMVVIAIIAGLIGTVAIIVPQMQEKQKRFNCQNNLKELGGLFVAESTMKSGKPKYEGQALWLSWRANSSKIKEGQEGILICPGDGGISAADTQEAKDQYTNVDLKNPADLCSYTSRDFTTYPLNPEAKKIQIIGCDRNGPDGRTPHHKNGVNAVFEDGASRFVEREELGIGKDDPVVVGPDSPAEMLKTVIYNKARRD